VREKLDRNALSDAAQLKTEIKSHIVRILNASDGSKRLQPAVVAGSPNGKGPRVIFIVGVNGAGKTTSIGKLANRLRKEGSSVISALRTLSVPPPWSSLRFGRSATASK